MENDTTTSSDDPVITIRVMVVLLSIAEVPAILCSLLILTFFLSHWRIMTKALHNHAVFLLIIVSFLYVTLDLPFTINSYHIGYDRPRTPSFCLWWYWLDYTMLSTSLAITATSSLQRHILIFHSSLIRRQSVRSLIHYGPLLISVLYPAVFYVFAVYLYPCASLYDDESLYCPNPCYSYIITIYNIDWAVNYIAPVFIIAIANITLIVRVIYSKYKFRRHNRDAWKKQRKLTLHLLSFSLLYIFGWGPSTFISLIRTFILPNLLVDYPQLSYVANSCYFICPLQSFICIFGIPELMRSIRHRLGIKRKVRIIPAGVLGETRL